MALSMMYNAILDWNDRLVTFPDVKELIWGDPMAKIFKHGEWTFTISIYPLEETGNWQMVQAKCVV